jgi:hypothetical protein
LQNQRQHIDRAEGDYWTNRVLRHPFHEGWVVIAASARGEKLRIQRESELAFHQARLCGGSKRIAAPTN